MRAFRILLGAGVSALTLLFATGCYNLASDCELNFNCESSGGSGGSGGTGGAPAVCIPANNSAPVDDSCGVFVSSTKGEDTNEGTKQKPFATVTMAFTAAKGKPIYLCGETLLESVEINETAEIYGGLDCGGDWAYDAATPTVLNASADMIPLRVGSQTRVILADLHVKAEDALVSGGSSIAMIAEAGAEVSLTRCRLEAGNGANGANGDTPVEPTVAGKDGIDGVAACTANQVLTLDPPVTDCDGGAQSNGGLGGIGTQAQGGAGSPGEPQGSMNGGLGEGAAVCTDGGPGDTGAAGVAGNGASGNGALQAGLGFVGAKGTDGKGGGPGQGGGGGGGAKGGTGSGKCPAGTTGGASGGTGASGGCGGAGGKGGGAGGASIGIASLGAKLTLKDVVIDTKAGGKGGNGGAGQTGGLGGVGGVGGSKSSFVNLNNACKGGDGGAGGPGGRGGGGRGGHSIGIAHTGDPPDITGATITTGTAGNGGTGEGATGEGAAGATETTLGFN